MDPVLGGALAGGGQLAGGILDYIGQNNANNQNWDQFVSNQAFNANVINSAKEYDYMMSNSAVQRRMEDMKKAGVNPLLAVAGQGAGGGSSPSNNPGVGNAAQNPMAGAGRSLSGAMSSALGAVSTIETVKNVEQDTALKKLQGINEIAKTVRETSTAHNLDEQTSKTAFEKKFLQGEFYKSREEEAKTASNKAIEERKNEALKQLLGLVGQGSGILKDATGSLEDIMNSLNPIGKGLKNVGDLFKGNAHKPIRGLP